MRRVCVLAVVLAGIAAPPAHATVPAGNLLANPGAEAGPGGATENDVNQPPSWTTTGAFTATQYGPDGPQAFPTTSQSASYGGGANFFAGGNQATSTGTQVVDVSGAAAEIDAGSVSAAFSGLVGGYQNQPDTMTIVASYLDAGGATLGTLQLGPVTPDQRSNTTELLPQSATGTVPAGTRSVQVIMTASRSAGTSNDGYADNLSLTLSGPGGGGPQPGQHGTTTSLACNRGPDPDSPWTCSATVLDTSPDATAPGGTVAFASSHGGSFAGPGCTLSPSPSRPASATCSDTFTMGSTGTTLSATYAGDSAHGGGSDAFTLHGPGDVLFCGAAPLPACPGGRPPPQVCVSIWVGDCDGRLPPPSTLQVCLSAFENCNGFGGSHQARPGTIDLSGLPASTTTTLGCGGKPKASARQGLPIPDLTCPTRVQIVQYSSITDGKKYAEAARTWTDLVENLRHGQVMMMGGDIQPAINGLFRLAHFQDPAYGHNLRVLIEATTDDVYNCLKPAGTSSVNCSGLQPAQLPVCSSPLGGPMNVMSPPKTFSGSKTDEQTCNDVVRAWLSQLFAAVNYLIKYKSDLGVDKPFKATLRARGSKARRTFAVLMTGTATVKRGKTGKLKLKLAKGAKALLRTERKGARQVKATVIISRERIIGLAPLQTKKSVHVVLAH